MNKSLVKKIGLILITFLSFFGYSQQKSPFTLDLLIMSKALNSNDISRDLNTTSKFQITKSLFKN